MYFVSASDEEPVTMDHIKKMKYLECVIKVRLLLYSNVCKLATATVAVQYFAIILLTSLLFLNLNLFS